MRIVNYFCKMTGDEAEKEFVKNYFPSIGLKFKKILESKDYKTPDGFIIDNENEVALVEIKLINSSKEESAWKRIAKTIKNK